jgi:hypothetical protein
LVEHDTTPSDEIQSRVTSAISQGYGAIKAHEQELNAVWSQTTSENRDELVYAFRNLLAEEYPTEHSELTQYVRCQEAELVELLEILQEAYLVGYMLGKGWISEFSATAMLASHGAQVTEYIQSALEEAQSQAVAFTEALAAVVGKGTQFSRLGTEY